MPIETPSSSDLKPDVTPDLRPEAALVAAPVDSAGLTPGAAAGHLPDLAADGGVEVVASPVASPAASDAGAQEQAQASATETGAPDTGAAQAAARAPRRGERRATPEDTAACAAELRARFPALFDGPPRPLKLRIQADIQQRAPGVFTRAALSAFLHRHTTRTPYLIALTQHGQRLDLDGQPAGEVAAEHREAAAQEVERRRARRQERQAHARPAPARAADAPPAPGEARVRNESAASRPPGHARPERGEHGARAERAERAERHASAQGRARPDERARHASAPQHGTPEDSARRERARLLRDFESSPLAKANFCVLKGITPQALDAQLALAREEAAAWAAARPPAQPPAPKAEDRMRAGPARERSQAPHPARRDGAPSQPREALRQEPRPRREAHEARQARDPRPPRSPHSPHSPHSPQAAQAAQGARTAQAAQETRAPGARRAQALPATAAEHGERPPLPAPVQLVAAAELQELLQTMLARGGSAPLEAECVARHLVDANLAGHDAQGAALLPRCVDDLLAGALHANRQIAVLRDHGALLTLDAQAGYGPMLGEQAMQLAIERARVHGVAVIGLVNAHHLGRIGAYAELGLAQGLVCLHFVNVIGQPQLAPLGGSDLRLAMHAVCIGVPMGPGQDPLLLDFATGRLPGAAARPRRAPRDELPRPFGGHKGYGLALACELLAGALGGGLTLHAQPAGGATTNNMLSIVIDPERMGTAAHLGAQARAFAQWLQASPPAREAGVMLPGEPERRTRSRRSAEGIPIDAGTAAELRAAGVRLGLEEAALRARLPWA